MINLKTFENLQAKPVKKFPAPKSLNFFNIVDHLQKNYKIDIYNVKPPEGSLYTRVEYNFFDFLSKKLQKNVIFPKVSIFDIYPDNRGTYLEERSVIQIPISYDSKLDFADSIETKVMFKTKMMNMLKSKFKTNKEMKDFEDTLDTHVNYGNATFEWANKILEILYKDFKQYYVDGKLNIWNPYDSYEWKPKNKVELRHPHEFDEVGNFDKPDGVYYFSDIVNYIENRYGISDDKFYDFIIMNQYVEGRYWERVWYFLLDEKTNKFPRKDPFSGRGMDATENINHMLNIIEKDFADEIYNSKKSEYHGEFEIFMDTYKKIIRKR